MKAGPAIALGALLFAGAAVAAARLGRAAPRRAELGPEFFSSSCRPEDFLGQETARVRAGYRALQPYVGLLFAIMGPAELRSWWRPRACNDRGPDPGAPRSRHLEGWAVDLRVTPEQTRALVRAVRATGGGRLDARAWGDYVRQRLGIRQKVGLRVYPSGNLHIDLGCPPGGELCDPRSADWLDVASGWR